MKKHKSKTNILSDDKQAQKFITMMKKQKQKNQNCRKSTTKLGHDQKKIQTKLNHPQKTTNMHSKTKSYLEKMTIILPQQNHKSQLQSFSATQRRKSASVIPQRVDSRLSKRGSIASNKSNKDKKTENLKENDKNRLNLNQVQELQNQQIGTTSKKNSKKLLNKKKNQLNLNSKPKNQPISFESQKKVGQKSKNYQEFENKMSRYLQSKDIFSKNVSRQKSNHSKQSKKSSSQKKIPQKDLKFVQQKSSGILKNKQRQNLLGIYQFYKKTFDINFNNCFKRGKNLTKVDKNSQNSSKSALKPFYSSIVVDRHLNSSNKNQQKHFFQTNNQTKISVSGILNQNDQTQKSKRTGSISICNKQNQSKLKLQKSSLVNSRSKSNVNSDSSTKDNLFYWKVQQQNIDQNIIEAKKQKKSYKDLILFNDKLERSFPKKQVSSERCFQNLKKSQKIQQANELSKISFGQSNIQVLKWSCNEENKQIKDEHPMILKSQEKSKQKELIPKQGSLKKDAVTKKQPQNILQKVEIFQQKSNIKTMSINYFEEQNLDVTKLIKKRSKEDQFGNLDDLSSISLINDRKDGTSQNPFSTSPKKNPAFLQIDAIDFQL